MVKYYVYEVWDRTANLPFYVGKSNSSVDRHAQHLKEMRRRKNGTPFHKKLRSMIEDGEPYDFQIVFESSEEVDALAEEVRLISLYGRRDLQTGPLLNLTAGGEGTSGRVPTEATLQLMRERALGKTPGNKGKKYHHPTASPKKGKPWTETQRHWFDNRTPDEIERRRQRASASHKGRVPSEEQRLAHSKRMSGSRNPNFGKVGVWAGKVGPWAGRSHPNKGRKKGPDGKLYSPDALLKKASAADD